MVSAIFTDCGDVLFDNARAQPEWEQKTGEYYSSRYGGSPDDWIRANNDAHSLYIEQYKCEAWGHPEMNYNAFLHRERPRMVERMFTSMQLEPPEPEERISTLNAATTWISEHVHAAIPKAIDTAKQLDETGYRMYTCSGVDSLIVRAKLTSAGIAEIFRRHYGPDLINCPKEGALFYRKIFEDSGEDAASSVVIDDKKFILDWAAETGAICIRIGDDDISGTHRTIATFAELPSLLETLL